MFERYVNFEFYKTLHAIPFDSKSFERYVNFEFYKTRIGVSQFKCGLRDM